MDYKRGIRHNRPISTILNQSKGQLSLFLIVAVVLLLILTGYFLIQNYFNRQTFSTDLTDPSLTSIQKYVLGCIEQSLRSGVKLAAVQGGYIQVPPDVERNPRLYVSSHPDGYIKTPLWIGPSGASFIPTQKTVEEQLANHIDATIPSCLNNLSVIAQIANIDVYSLPKANVSLNEKDISVILKYDVSYAERGKNISESQFSYTLSVPLLIMIQEATKIAQKMYNEEFLSLATIDLLSIADENQIPLSNMKLQCEKPKWQVEDVRTNITQLLYQMIPRIRVLGGESTPFEASESSYIALQRITPDDFSEPALDAKPIKQKVPRGYANAPVDTYEYNHLLFDAGNEAILKKNDLTVSLGFMPSYGMEMEVRPSENGVMTGAKQQGDNKFLPFLCVQVYHFTYDLIFPVEVGIVRENAFKDGSPLTLRFALPVQIQRNLPNQDDFSITTTVDTPGGRLCDQKVNYQTQIIATDIFTGQQINGANVEFHCYKYACELGKTSKLQSYDPELTTSLPSFCSGGSVSISHPQYITNEEAFYEAPQKIDLRMIPLKNISFSVMLGPNPRSNNAQPSELNVNQQAIVQLTSQEIDYQTAIAYPGDPSMANIIQLVAAKAKYNATVLVYETTDGENGQLIGGYIGELDVRLTANLNQRLTFYAYDFGQPVNPEDLPDAMNTLTTNEIIKAAHSPGWG